MPISIEQGHIVVADRPPLTPDILRTCLDRHLSEDPLTNLVEEHAERYVSADFPTHETLLFVRLVCAWGGARPRNYVHIYEENCGDAFAVFTRQLQYAHDQSLLNNHADAIDAVSGFRGVGISFGSKFLRFLCPDRAVVLDKNIRQRCGYDETNNDYAQFVHDCSLVRDNFNAAGFRRDGVRPWRCCDVEMAIYKYVEVRE
jgi:hypothetical protein